MALLQKLFAPSKPKADSLSWAPLSSTTSKTDNLVRVLLLRESDSSKKLLFDSETTQRHLPPLQSKKHYDQVYDGVGYTLTHPSRSDTRELGDMMFGAVPIAKQNECIKVHPIKKDEIMWSTLFRIDDFTTKISQPTVSTTNASDHSLASSFGSSLGSSMTGKGSESLFLNTFDTIHETIGDSGVFSLSASQPTSFEQFSVGSSCKWPSGSALCLRRRRAKESCQASGSAASETAISSSCSVGLPPSFPAIKVKPASSESSLTATNECSEGSSMARSSSQPSSEGKVGCQGKSTSELLTISSSVIQRKRSKMKLALGIIISTPTGLCSPLLDNAVFMEDLLSRLKYVSSNAYKSRDAFFHIIYRGFLEASATVSRFFSMPSLNMTVWHLLANDRTRDKGGKQFLSDFAALKKNLDTKELKFFLCTWLSVLLTFHPVWVFSVIPANSDVTNVLAQSTSEANSKSTAANIPVREIMKKAHQPFLYNAREAQLADLYGMASNSNRLVKFVLAGGDEASLKKVLNFTTYFIRSSMVTRQTSVVSDDDDLDVMIHCQTVKLPRSPKGCEGGDKVQKGVLFVLGENEHLVASNLSEQQRASKNSSAETPHRKNSSYTIVDLPSFELFEKRETYCPLPSPICISDQLMPGSFLQGLIVKRREGVSRLKASIRRDLRVTNTSCGGEVITILGDLSSGDVDLFSSRHTDANGIPMSMSPLVANLVDSMDELVFQCPLETTLGHVEDCLRHIYLQSRFLAALLVPSDSLVSLDNLVNSLGVDRHDVPLLMSVATAHSPELTTRYGLTFSP